MNETETRSLISPPLFVYLGYCGWVEERLLLRPKLEKAYQKNYAEWQTMSLEIRSEWIPVWLYRGLKRRVNIYPSVPIVSLLGRVPRTLQAPQSNYYVGFFFFFLRAHPLSLHLPTYKESTSPVTYSKLL